MTGQLADVLSFRRIVRIPFDTYMTALDSWSLTGHDGELGLGASVLQGPIEDDHYFGTWHIEVRLARGRLRPPVRMRLEIAPWYAGYTALELFPRQRVRPSAAYAAAAERLLDRLTRPQPARVPTQQRPDQKHLHATVSAGVSALSCP